MSTFRPYEGSILSFNMLTSFTASQFLFYYLNLYELNGGRVPPSIEKHIIMTFFDPRVPSFLYTSFAEGV